MREGQRIAVAPMAEDDPLAEEIIEASPHGQRRKRLRCKRCGSDQVIFLMHQGNWRLCNNETGEPHHCPRNVTAKADFRHLKRRAS